VNLRRDSMAHLVRSLRTCARIRSLTTGTFNQVVKDRTGIPPERRQSVQQNPCKNPAVLETLQTYCAAPASSTHASHRISTAFSQREFRSARQLQGPKPGSFGIAGDATKAASWSNPDAQQYASSALQVPESTGILGHARAEDRKLSKELALEVLALKVPFRSGSFRRNQASESCPVAGTNFRASYPIQH